MFRAEARIPSLKGVYSTNLVDLLLSNQPDLASDVNLNNIVLLGLAWGSLISDSPSDPIKPKCVIHKFLLNYVKDPFGLIGDYSHLADKLLRSLVIIDGTLIIKSLFHEFSDTPIFREYKIFHETGNHFLLRFILTFLTFGKKSYFDRSNLNTIAFRDWVKVEERLSAVQMPSIVGNLRRLTSYLFRDWKFDAFLPKHGSGSVSERDIKTISQKNRGYRLDKRISYLYQRDKNILLYEDYTLGPLDTSVTFQNVEKQYSRLMFVPKNYKTTRSICMEPAVLQWAQQGVRLCYEHYLSESFLKDHVFLRDQSVNRRYARIGSLSGLVDTIDLSAASDSVSLDLVKSIFPSKVLKHFLATRSAVVELPDGTIFPLRKFAPMGSALCFPVQSTIYSLICLLESIAFSTGLRSDDPDLPLSWSFAPGIGKYDNLIPFVCYGDDIICDKRITSNVVRSLSLLGFEVNLEKSFLSESAVRESCGLYAFAGFDITPLNFKAKKLGRYMDAACSASLISLANRAFDYNYLNLRKFLINLLLRYPVKRKNRVKGQRFNAFRFSSDRNDSLSIFTLNPLNSHLRRRSYDPFSTRKGSHQDYQRSEIKCLKVRAEAVEDRDPNQDSYFFTAWQRSRYSGGGDLSFDRSPTAAYTIRTGITLGWNPA